VGQIRIRFAVEQTGAGFKRGSVDCISAIWVCFEKDLKFLAIELLVAVLIPISEVGCGAQPKSPFHEVNLAVAVEVPAL